MFTDLKLDTVSDYICDPQRWPKPACDVMVESEKLRDVALTVLDMSPEEGYVDMYAIIDPERELVTEFQLIGKIDDGSQLGVTLKVDDMASAVEYFEWFLKQGGDEFREFIEKSCEELAVARSEYHGCLIDAVDDFLEERNVRIPTSDKAMEDDDEGIYNVILTRKETGETNSYPCISNEERDSLLEGVDVSAYDVKVENTSKVRIYGPDYDELVKGFVKITDTSIETVIIDKIRARQQWANEYLVDELDVYMELGKYTYDQIEKALGSEFVEHMKEFQKEHGLV